MKQTTDEPARRHPGIITLGSARPCGFVDESFGPVRLLRATEQVIECLGTRVVSQRLCLSQAGSTAAPVDMAGPHRKIEEWSAQGLSQWAPREGPGNQAVIEKMMSVQDHPTQSFRVCLGILCLGLNWMEQKKPEMAMVPSFRFGFDEPQ